MSPVKAVVTRKPEKLSMVICAKRKIQSAKCLQKKKMERAYTSRLTEHLQDLEKQEANTPMRSSWQGIIKLRAEINQI